ncbi:MAG: sulfotransferase family protein [Gammaproteobacteria bacterium]
MPSAPPFFILGCVRSGTTMLRNVLRMHPNLAAPEETHFYRWPEPFGTESCLRQLANNKTLLAHRAIDTITDAEFRQLLSRANSRQELYQGYMRLFIRKTKPGAERWFDKTPQNVYGAAMIAADFPKSRFVHIVRNPLDVVLSLRTGKVMHVESLVGAANYWRESAAILQTLRKAYPGRELELRYEDFMQDPRAGTSRVLDFVQEPFDPGFMDAFEARPSEYDHAALLNPGEVARIRRLCGRWAERYGYTI